MGLKKSHYYSLRFFTEKRRLKQVTTIVCVFLYKKRRLTSASSLYAVSESQLIKLIKSVTLLVLNKQAGNGPSRRHIQGSKIAKGLQSVKYSLLQYPRDEKLKKIPIFEVVFKCFVSDKSHSAE